MTERYETIRDNCLARLEEITAAPKPSYNIDGQSFKHGEYLKQLQDTLKWAEQQISAANFREHATTAGLP